MSDIYWQEDEDPSADTDITDLAFSIECRCVPADHAWLLAQELQRALPWWTSDPQMGLHLLGGAESGNGWERAGGTDSTIFLTRRCRLQLRLPKSLVTETVKALSGRRLDLGGYPLQVESATVRSLLAHPTVYARHLLLSSSNEAEFIAEAVQALRMLAVPVKKILAGKERTLSTAAGPLITRSLLVTDLKPAESIKLQEQGIGSHRYIGCGVFVPHKNLG